MNEVDAVKQLRLLDERKYVDEYQVEQWSRLVLDGLVSWSNRNIFSSLGGELAIELPVGAPNAGVYYDSLEPLRPKMMIRQSMLTDIYRDAFTFPLICRRIISDTNTVEHLHSNPLFNGKPFLFSTGAPELDVTLVHAGLRPWCEAMVRVHQEKKDNVIQCNDLHCRFVMFELMLVWTFFHELGHVVQRHIRLRDNPHQTDGVDTYFELDELLPAEEMADSENAKPASQDLRAQARELMADAEALDLTLKYLLANGRLKFPMVYLLICSVSCMLQRFYQNYSDNLNITHHRHPHPVIRDELSQSFLTNSIHDVLVASNQFPDHHAAAIPVAYLSVRASLFTGLFRSHRVERRDDPSKLPSYMRLQTEVTDVHGYLEALMPHIEEQVNEVLQSHLLSDNRLNDWLQLLRARMIDARTSNAPVSA